MSQQIIKFNGTDILPGSRQTIHLTLPSLYTHNHVTMPVHIIHGRRPGPKLVITSALHGDEINGIEILRRLLGKKYLNTIKGTLVLAPIVNVYGFLARTRYLPDRRDLNRSFPGSNKGSMSARLAYQVIEKLIKPCDYLIDIHTGAVFRDNLAQIRIEAEKDNTHLELARAFGAPVILKSAIKEGTLRQTARRLGKKVLLYEAGEALRYDEIAIRAGLDGILGVMTHLDMIKRKKKKVFDSIITTSSQWVRASQSGVFRSVAPLGKKVDENDVLGYISDPFGNHEECILSPTDGIIIGKTKLPLVHEGEAIFHIGRFKEPDEAADNIETFQDVYNPLTDPEDPPEPPII